MVRKTRKQDDKVLNVDWNARNACGTPYAPEPSRASYYINASNPLKLGRCAIFESRTDVETIPDRGREPNHNQLVPNSEKICTEKVHDGELSKSRHASYSLI
jgi:hypothetical protein